MADEAYEPQKSGRNPGVGNAWAQKMADKALEEKQEVLDPLPRYMSYFYQERNKIRGRRGKAVAYMDNQIRTILSMLKQNGGTMTYGDLFIKTQDTMDALSAILNAAQKRGVVK